MRTNCGADDIGRHIGMRVEVSFMYFHYSIFFFFACSNDKSKQKTYPLHGGERP